MIVVRDRGSRGTPNRGVRGPRAAVKFWRKSTMRETNCAVAASPAERRLDLRAGLPAVQGGLKGPTDQPNNVRAAPWPEEDETWQERAT